MKGHVGRKKSATTEEVKEKLKDAIAENPMLSLRKSSDLLNISHASVRNILKKELKWIPYKISVVHKIPPQAIQMRFKFAKEVLKLIENKELDWRKVWFTDEAHVHLEGFVNKQNMRFWGSQRPSQSIEVPLHSKKVTVWAAISAQGIIGPFFFDELQSEMDQATALAEADEDTEIDERATVSRNKQPKKKKPTVDSYNYRHLLEEHFFPEAHAFEVDAQHGFYFMQDGAKPHRTLPVFSSIEAAFDENVIAYEYPKKMNKGIDWPSYSCDLNPCDFYLWGYMKDKLFANSAKLPSLDELKVRIREKISEIDSETCVRVMENFVKRLKLVKETKGHHFENMF